jgi:acyl carrier protein
LPAPELEKRIIEFAASQTGLDPAKIRLDSRLLHDLGMDGDDAVEFFENFSREFGVDITVLNEDWDRHFGPEGGASPILLIVCGLSVGFGVIVHSEVPAVPFWVGNILFLVPTLYILWKINPVSPRIVPITIRDLISAVRVGRWFSKE